MTSYLLYMGHTQQNIPHAVPSRTSHIRIYESISLIVCAPVARHAFLWHELFPSVFVYSSLLWHKIRVLFQNAFIFGRYGRYFGRYGRYEWSWKLANYTGSYVFSLEYIQMYFLTASFASIFHGSTIVTVPTSLKWQIFWFKMGRFFFFVYIEMPSYSFLIYSFKLVGNLVYNLYCFEHVCHVLGRKAL